MRLVDLDGKTWDGTQLNSKYRPMYDAQGRNEMMAITMGWLIDAPKFDLDKHDAEVRAKAIDEVLETLSEYDSVLSLIPASDLQGIICVIEQLKEGGK